MKERVGEREGGREGGREKPREKKGANAHLCRNNRQPSRRLDEEKTINSKRITERTVIGR